MTSPWDEGGRRGNTIIQRNYHQIIADASSPNSNVLIQFKLHKIISISDIKPPNLTHAQVGEFLFDILKIKPESCLEIDLNTGRYDTRELLLRPGTDLTGVITSSVPHIFKEHEITVKMLSQQVTKVTFRNVPMSVPDEEIVHLCSQYGDLVDGRVHREVIRLGGATRYSLVSSTRWAEVKLKSGMTFNNFYWMVGPGQGDMGRRITVLHANQRRQCSWCFLYPSPTPSSPPVPGHHCMGGGNGKTCETSGTPRAKMTEYIEHLRAAGYVSLKDQYLAEQAGFPGLRGPTRPRKDIQESLDRAVNNSNDALDDDHDDTEGDGPLHPPPSFTSTSSSSELTTTSSLPIDVVTTTNTTPNLQLTNTVNTPSKSTPVSSPSFLTTPRTPASFGSNQRWKGGLNKDENPLHLHINSKGKLELSDEQVKQYAIQALALDAAYLEQEGDFRVPRTKPAFLAKSKADLGDSTEKKEHLLQVEARVLAYLGDPVVQQEGLARLQLLEESKKGEKSRARTFSEAEIVEEDTDLTKISRLFSPPQK